MKKIIFALFTFIITSLALVPAIADDSYTLSAGVAIKNVPKTFYGTWRVTAKLDDSNSYGTFKPQSVDMWTLSRVGDFIKLSNPILEPKDSKLLSLIIL